MRAVRKRQMWPRVFLVLYMLVTVLTIGALRLQMIGGQIKWTGIQPLRPQSATVRAVGGSIVLDSTETLPVTVSDVQDLGAVTAVVTYDRAVLHPTECRRNPTFDVGLCNMNYDNNQDGEPDSVRFNVISLNGASVSPGESLSLVEITWSADGMLGDVTALNLTVETFTDSDAIPIADVVVKSGKVTVVPEPPPTPTPTATLIAEGNVELHLPAIGRNTLAAEGNVELHLPAIGR